jgi:hypothetical protein
MHPAWLDSLTNAVAAIGPPTEINVRNQIGDSTMKKYIYTTKIFSGRRSRKNSQFAIDHFFNRGRLAYMHRVGRPSLTVTTPDGTIIRCRVSSSFTV